MSQRAHIFAHQLSRCPSYSASHGPSQPAAKDDEDLPALRTAFAREVKRNLFDAYLRPSKTVITLVSNSISSSSCPGGEGMQFSSSPMGHHILAYNSSRICVIDVRGRDIAVTRELKILRRPAATCIRDDGSMLAVLQTEMQVDLYDLGQSPPKRTHSIILDHSPRAIALSPCGSVLAAAYEGGIEVSSLNPGALATDRRAVKCDGVDALAFSFDGTQILGTTIHAAQPNTVILTAPYYDPGSHIAEDDMSALWTTSILFPNTSRDCSHAVLLQKSSREEASWTFTYDRSFETFRAVRIDDLRNGTTYFTGPIPSARSQGRLLPCTLPAASYHGDLVSAGFQGKDIWLYGVPEDLDAVSDAATSINSSEGVSAASSLNRRNSGPSMRSASRLQEHSTDVRVPQWQVLCDKLRNTFIGGVKIGELCGVTNLKWVEGFGDSSLKERLVVAARGVLSPEPANEEDGIDFIDGGRLTLIDFDYGLGDGQVTEITIEVGTKEPEALEEEHRDMDTEVAIVRRRTVAQRRGNRSAVMRAATTAGRAPPVPEMPPPPPSEPDVDDPLIPRRFNVLPTRPTAGAEQAAAIAAAAAAAPASDETETASIIEEQEALDAPYSHASPRSGTTLRRAATAAAMNRRLHPSAPAAGPVQYRRADGRGEHPHESDADNWVPPPPPYQKEDPQDMPDFLRHNVPAVAVNSTARNTTRNEGPPPVPPLPRLPPPSPSAGGVPEQLRPQRSQTVAPSNSRGLPAARTEAPLPPLPAAHHQRVASDSTTGRPRTSVSTRHMSVPSAYHFDDDEDLYDVSPPDSPRQTPNDAPATVRNVSDGSGFTAGPSRPSTADQPQDQVAAGSLAPPQHAAPTVPRIQTTSANTSPRVPVLDLEIPSSSLSSTTMWHTPMSGSSPAARRISNSQTWPSQPPPHGPLPAVLPAGYPYSAPPTNLNANEMIAQAYPPAPRPDQLESLNRHDGPAGTASPRRLSGGFQVPRVPVGSRESRRFSANTQAPFSPTRHPLQQHPPQLNPPQLQHPRPQRVPDLAAAAAAAAPPGPPPPPVEDQPLIISTPEGVSGAFDPPGRIASTRREGTPILAPVPRHPRANETSAVLRPQAERLETIYSVASGHLGPAAPPGAASSSSHYLGPPSQSTRGSSLNRKQSRAERSAAKNIADAKKRGWRRSKSKRRRKPGQTDFDAASSAAWTDITASSTGYAYQAQAEGAAPSASGRLQKGKSNGGKCVVM